MSQMDTKVEAGSKDFESNAEAMRTLVSELADQIEAVELGGGDDARIKHLKRGKMLPRDRVLNLLDKDSPLMIGDMHFSDSLPNLVGQQI